MRLWHYKLIPYLPRQQLLGQWRECCLIAKNLTEHGTPNHILVNPVINYPPVEFLAYWILVGKEMETRGIHVNQMLISSFQPASVKVAYVFYIYPNVELFQGWHNDRYLWQCYYNLQEKYDRGGIPHDEWDTFERACYSTLLEYSGDVIEDAYQNRLQK